MAAGTSRNFLPDSRISASTVPNRMPPSVATAVSAKLKYIPLRMYERNTSPVKKEKSSACISVPAPAGLRDEARHPRPLLDEGHDAVDGEGRHDVQRRHRHVDLDAARGLLAHLLGVEGQLRDGDGKRHRGILEDVHRLAGERRDDDTKG